MGCWKHCCFVWKFSIFNSCSKNIKYVVMKKHRIMFPNLCNIVLIHCWRLPHDPRILIPIWEVSQSEVGKWIWRRHFIWLYRPLCRLLKHLSSSPLYHILTNLVSATRKVVSANENATRKVVCANENENSATNEVEMKLFCDWQTWAETAMLTAMLTGNSGRRKWNQGANF